MTTIAAPVPVEREFTVRSRSQLQLAVRRFARNPLAVGGLASFLILMAAAFVGPRFLPFGYDEQTDALSAPPGTDGHLFGTDTIGRDVLGLTLRGIQWSARSPIGVALLIAVSSWMALARIVRAPFLSLREREYVEAAHALGARDRRILLRHLIPNALGDITVWLTLGATAAIGTVAALSFIGYGVQGSEVSLGRLVAEGAAAAESRPWLFYFPGVTLLLIVLSVSLIGDGIQDAFDPSRTRHR